jgi:hypothetical protein
MVAWLALLAGCSTGAAPEAPALLQRARRCHGFDDRPVRLLGQGRILRSAPEGEFAGTFRFWSDGDLLARREEQFFGRRALFVRRGREIAAVGDRAMIAGGRPGLAVAVTVLAGPLIGLGPAAAADWLFAPSWKLAARHRRIGSVDCWFDQEHGGLLGLEFRRDGSIVRLELSRLRSIGSLRLPFHQVTLVDGRKDEELVFERLRSVRWQSRDLFRITPSNAGTST